MRMYIEENINDRYNKCQQRCAQCVENTRDKSAASEEWAWGASLKRRGFRNTA